MGLIAYIYENCKEEDGKQYLECAVAFQIAKQFHINVSEVGKLCNENKIKIKHCQIGCF